METRGASPHSLPPSVLWVPLTRGTDGNSYRNWKNTSKWSHTQTSKIKGYWPPDSTWRRDKLRLGSSSVPWSRRCALALFGYGSLAAMTLLPVFPTKPAATSHHAGGSGSFPSIPPSPQPAVSTLADSAIQSLLFHRATPTYSPNPLDDSWLHRTHQKCWRLRRAKGSIPKHLDAKTDGTRQKRHGRW